MNVEITSAPLLVEISPTTSEVAITNASAPSVTVSTQGPQGANANLNLVEHGNDTGIVRPAFSHIIWLGDAEPANAENGDIWFQY